MQLPGSIGSADVFDGVLGVMTEVMAKKISSEEETFSDLSLMIYHNNWLGGYSQILPFATVSPHFGAVKLGTHEIGQSRNSWVYLPRFLSEFGGSCSPWQAPLHSQHPGPNTRILVRSPGVFVGELGSVTLFSAFKVEGSYCALTCFCASADPCLHLTLLLI